MKRARSENENKFGVKRPLYKENIENHHHNKNNNKNNNKDQSVDIFQRGKALFRRTAVPSRLIGRETERDVMLSFWTKHVLANQPGCLYVSGSPGTGKTAMLNDVKRHMEQSTSKHPVNIVMINCMSIHEPKAIYSKLVTELKNTSSLDPQLDVIVQAEQLLFNTKKNTINVVILDEIDHLITKDQDVLYKIFEWAFLPSSRLVLIGIANALNLTDLVLPRLRAKNCEPQLLNFNPYGAAEISAIIKDRLHSLSNDKKELPLMQPIAVELCAKKVAARKGDLRQAFDLCQQAIELAQKEYKRSLASHSALPPAAAAIAALPRPNKNVLGDSQRNNRDTTISPLPSSLPTPKVTVRHISSVSQLVGSKEKLAQLSLQQQIVMATLLILKQKKKARITMADARVQYTSMLKSNGTVPPVTPTELFTIISNIQDTGLLIIKPAKEQIKQQILLNVEDADIQHLIDTIPLLQNIFQ